MFGQWHKEVAKGEKGLGLYHPSSGHLTGANAKGHKAHLKKHRIQQLAVFLEILLFNIFGIDNSRKSTI